MAMWEMDSFCKRNGYGMQEWSDGSKYEGEYKNNLKHGTGVYTWPNGEVWFNETENQFSLRESFSKLFSQE